jgi:hypothetical protein
MLVELVVDAPVVVPAERGRVVEVGRSAVTPGDPVMELAPGERAIAALGGAAVVRG